MIVSTLYLLLIATCISQVDGYGLRNHTRAVIFISSVLVVHDILLYLVSAIITFDHMLESEAPEYVRIYGDLLYLVSFPVSYVLVKDIKTH